MYAQPQNISTYETITSQKYVGSLLQPEQSSPKSKRVIPSTIRSIVTITSLSTTTLLNHQIPVRCGPRRIQPFDSIVVRIQQLCNRPDLSPRGTADFGRRAMRVCIGGERDVVASVVLEDILRTAPNPLSAAHRPLKVDSFSREGKKEPQTYPARMRFSSSAKRSSPWL